MAGRQEAAGLLAGHQQRLAAAPGFGDIKLEIDFAHFENHPNFKETSSSRQADLLRNLASDVLEKGLWNSNEGLVAWLEQSERAKRMFLEKTQRIVVRMSPESNVDPGKGNSYYMIRWEDNAMVVTARMDCVSYTDGWGTKTDEQLKLNILDELYIVEATTKLAEVQQRFADGVGSEFIAPTLEVDWSSFVNDNHFLERSDHSRKNLVLAMVEEILEKGLFNSNEGLLAWLAKSARAKTIFFSRIGRILVGLSPDSNVDPRRGNSYYQLRIVNETTLVVTARLDCAGYTDGWGPKTDDEMGLHVLDEVYMKEALVRIQSLQEKFQVDSAADILLEVDWHSFISSQQFLERSDSSRKSMIDSIPDEVIQKGIWASQDGLVADYMNGSKRVRRLILENINKIVIKIQADSVIGNWGIGNSYYRIDWNNQDGNKSLAIVVRLDCISYTDGWGPKVDQKLGLHYRDETYLRAAEEQLASKRTQLLSDLSPLKPILIVDWDSFVRSDEFLQRNDDSRRNMIETVVDFVIQKGIWESNGLVTFFRATPNAFPSGLAAIIIKISPKSPVSPETGNSYYNLSVRAGPSIVVTVRLDCLNYTDGWSTKLKYHLKDLQSAQEAPIDLDPVHEYLKEQPEPVLPGPAFPAELHPYLVAPGASSIPQLSEEAKLARDKALAAAKARKEAEEAKKREEEELRKKRLEEQRRKREEAQAALRARQAARKASASTLRPTVSAASARKIGEPDESITAVKETLNGLKAAEARFNSAIGDGCAVEFVVDWSFLSDPAFLSLNEDQRKLCLTNYLSSYMIEALTNQLVNFKDNTAAKEEINSGLFVRVIFGYDTTNSIDSRVCGIDDYSRFYELAIRDGDLELRVNFHKRDNYLSSLNDKLACALNIQVACSKALIRQEFDKIEQDIVNSLGLAIDLEVDWSFTDSDAFMGDVASLEVIPLADLQRYKITIGNLSVLYAQNIIQGTYGIVQLCKNDYLYKDAVAERINTIIFSYDPTNSVNSPVSDNAKFWEMKLEPNTKTLRVNINLISYKDSPWYVKEKWDDLMQLRTAQGIRDAEKDIAETIEKARLHIGKKIEAFVDWKSFVSDPQYTSLTLDEKTSVFRTIASQHICQIFSGSYGLGSLCKDDAIYKKAINDRIDKVVLTYDAQNSVIDTIGGDYSRFYHVELFTDTKELRFTCNLKDIKTGLYDIKDKFDELLDVRVQQKQRDALKEIESIRNELSSCLGIAAQVTVDWDSFTNHPNFLKRPLEERGRICSRLVDSLVHAMVSSGLVSAAREPTSREIFSRQIKSLVISVDPTDSIKDDTVDSDYTRHYKVSHSGDELRLVCNLDSVISQSLYNVFEKIDAIFNLSLAKCRHEGQAMLEKYSRILHDKGIQANVWVDYDSFLTASQFLNRSAYEKGMTVRNLIETGVPALIEGNAGLLQLCDADHQIGGLAKTHIKSVVMAYDPKNLIKDPAVPDQDYSSYYSSEIYDDGRLVLTINLSSSDNTGSLYDLKRKLSAQLHFAEARKCYYPAFLEKHRQLMVAAVGHDITLEFDWDSLKKPAFLYFLEYAQVKQILHQVFETQAPRGFFASLAQVILEVCSTPMGKQAFAEAVSHVSVTVQGSTSIYIDRESRKLRVSAPTHFSCLSWPVAEWRQEIEWQLGQTVPVAKYYGQLTIERLEGEIACVIGKRIPISIDWQHIETPTFLNQGAAQVTRRINILTHDVAEAFLVKGLAAVCTHPVGKHTVCETISKISIGLDPSADYSSTIFGRFPSLISVDSDKTLVLRTNEEADSAKERFKERIEFTLDLVVKIAESNAQIRHNAAEASVSAAVGHTVKILYDLSFTTHQDFRVIAPSEQAEIITALCASLPEAVLTSTQGLLGVISHRIGKAAISEAIDTIYILADLRKSQPERGSLVLDRSSKKLTLTLNIDEVIAAVSWDEWKPRIADAVGVLLDICKIESATLIAPIAAQLSRSFGRSTPVEIAWHEFVQTSEWAALSPPIKLRIAHDLGGRLVNTALLGYLGLDGLTELAAIKAKINQSIKSTQFVLDPSNEQTSTQLVNSVLIIKIPMAKVAAGNFALPSIRFLVEDTLGLKPAIQAAVVQEINAAVARTEANISRALGKTIKVTIDWNALFSSALYQGTQDYVSFLRKRIISLAADAFEEPKEGLTKLLKTNPIAKKALNDNYTELLLRIDTTDQCKPPQFRFIPQYYSIEVHGSVIIVNMRLSAQNSRGCGPVLEWVLTPDLASAKEQGEITRIANARRDAELERREMAVRRTHQENEDSQKQYEREIRQYEKKMAEYERDSQKEHRPCEGTGWVRCKDYFHSGKSIMKTCHTCSGKGGHRCGPCHGTGLQYPNMKPPQMPKQPKIKSIPTFPPIDSIDWTDDIS